jgi:hypothetical protein
MLVCSLCEEDGRGNSALWTRLSRLVCAASVSPCALPLASPPAPRGPGRALLHSILPSIPAAHTRRTARPDTGEISDSDRMPKATLSFIKRNVDRAPLEGAASRASAISTFSLISVYRTPRVIFRSRADRSFTDCEAHNVGAALYDLLGTCHTRMKQPHTCTAVPSCVDNSQRRSRLVHAPPSHRPEDGMASDREVSVAMSVSVSVAVAVAVAACTSVGRQRDLSRGFDGESRRAPTLRAWSTHATMMTCNDEGTKSATWKAWKGPPPRRSPPKGGGSVAGRLSVRPPKGMAPRAPRRRFGPAAGGVEGGGASASSDASSDALPRVVGAPHHRGGDTADHGRVLGLAARRALPQAASLGLRPAWACGRVGVWACGRVGVWACGRVGVWACGRVGMWACGRVGMWACGRGAPWRGAAGARAAELHGGAWMHWCKGWCRGRAHLASG